MNAAPSHHPILVAVDGSDHATLACRIAADLARAWNAPVHIVHAWTPYLPPAVYGGMGSGAVLTQDTVEVLHESAVGVLAQARAVAERQGATVREHLVETMDTANTILAVADGVNAELIVAGRRGLGAVGRALFGSVSEALLHRSPRPLLLLHGDATCWPPRTVVAAVDGSEEATQAARLGAAVATATGATVHMVHAVPRNAGFLDNLNQSAYQATMAEVSATIHRRAEALHRVSGAPVTVDVELAAAVPAIMAAACAAPAPVLVAMGTHGRGAAYRMVLGSVATSVLHDEAVTSVLIVPPTHRGR